MPSVVPFSSISHGRWSVGHEYPGQWPAGMFLVRLAQLLNDLPGMVEIMEQWSALVGDGGQQIEPAKL
ncbi:hypothetical protein G1E_01936 [Pseudomonas sp. TJI-51]|nr:hypothetical protein G1E_01936 [Pseudomonas sp. TJI-51]